MRDSTNRLITSLADICREHMLAEKWLLTPPLRTAQQMIDQVAAAGQPVGIAG